MSVRPWMRLLIAVALMGVLGLLAAPGQAAPQTEMPRVPSFDPDQAREVAERLEKQGRAILEASKEAEPLQLPFLPSWVGRLFHDFNPAVAGLILVFSSLFRGWRMSLFVIPAAGVALVGERLGVPSVGPLTDRAVCLVAALALAGLGLLFGRSRA